jgi:hypothetical protein
MVSEYQSALAELEHRQNIDDVQRVGAQIESTRGG